MEYAIVTALGVVLLVVLLHSRPLDEQQIAALGMRRRTRSIEAYFQSDNRQYSVNLSFKKSLDPGGQFYLTAWPLSSTPATAAALLKHKKHEWVIIAFERNGQVQFIWVNKGNDNRSVSLFLSAGVMLETALRNNCTSVLVFHNHPNHDPRTYDCTHASETDRNSAYQSSRVLNLRGVNLVEYVCERGRHYRYCMYPSVFFMPIGQFTQAIRRVNGTSRLTNLRLHVERITGLLPGPAEPVTSQVGTN